MEVAGGERTESWGTVLAGAVERTGAEAVGAGRDQLAVVACPRRSRLKASSPVVLAAAVAAGIVDGQWEVLEQRGHTGGADPQVNHRRTFLVLEDDRRSTADDGALAGTGQTEVAVVGLAAVAAVPLLGTECEYQGNEMPVDRALSALHHSTESLATVEVVILRIH